MADNDFNDFEESLKETKPAMELPEAPLSVHIDAYYKGFHTGITIRSSDNQAIPIAKIVSAIDGLVVRGFEPSWNKQTSTDHLNGNGASVEVPGGNPVQAPICGIHSSPMIWKTGVSKKTGKPYAFWSCPNLNPDGSFCSFKPNVQQA